ncbi:MAG: hypothetical protein NTZ39_05955 [Methanoregula sp.]|nr:hypothetical protein [Methanoregula sp.]
MPIQIYSIGDVYGAGIQGAFYRYQESSLGSSFIPITQDLHYVTSGNYYGQTAVSILVWTAGDILLVLATILSLMKEQKIVDTKSKIVYSLLITSGMVFLISIMFQYGIFLYGIAGISIPLGIPLIIISGMYFFTQTADADL